MPKCYLLICRPKNTKPLETTIKRKYQIIVYLSSPFRLTTIKCFLNALLTATVSYIRFQAPVEDMQTMVLLEEIEGFKKKLKCPICNSAEKDAILTKCFHVFCYHCLKTRYETRNGFASHFWPLLKCPTQ